MGIKIGKINIDKFRALGDDEKLKLIGTVKTDVDLFHLQMLNIEAENKGYDKECENGHDFTDHQNINYLDLEDFYLSLYYGEGAEPAEYQQDVQVCRRCGAVKSGEKKLVKEASLGHTPGCK